MQFDKATATDFFRWSQHPVIIALDKPAVPYRAALVHTCGLFTRLARKVGMNLLCLYRTIFEAFCTATSQVGSDCAVLKIIQVMIVENPIYINIFTLYVYTRYIYIYIFAALYVLHTPNLSGIKDASCTCGR